MSQRRHKVLRKARKVAADALQLEFNSELGKLKRKRDDTIHEARNDYNTKVYDLQNILKVEIRDANAEFEKERAKLLTRLAEANAS